MRPTGVCQLVSAADATPNTGDVASNRLPPIWRDQARNGKTMNLGDRTMSVEQLDKDERAANTVFNAVMMRLSSLLGLTTGIGVVAWGVWSLVTTVLTFVYEETGVSTDEILISDSLNQGLLLSAIVIALGVMILELKKIQQLLFLQAGNGAGDHRI